MAGEVSGGEEDIGGVVMIAILAAFLNTNLFLNGYILQTNFPLQKDYVLYDIRQMRCNKQFGL